MSDRPEFLINRDVLLALSVMARLSSRTDLPTQTRLAISLGREILLDHRAHVSWYVNVGESRSIDEGIASVLVWLRLDEERRGRAAWRSRRAAEVVQTAVNGRALVN